MVVWRARIGTTTKLWMLILATIAKARDISASTCKRAVLRERAAPDVPCPTEVASSDAASRLILQASVPPPWSGARRGGQCVPGGAGGVSSVEGWQLWA